MVYVANEHKIAMVTVKTGQGHTLFALNVRHQTYSIHIALFMKFHETVIKMFDKTFLCNKLSIPLMAIYIICKTVYKEDFKLIYINSFKD